MAGLDLDEALAQAAERLHTPDTLEQTLQVMVEVARDSLVEVDHAGVTLATKGAVTTTAATDDFTHGIDQLQYDLGEGPCLHQLRTTGGPTVVEDLERGDTRWPTYVTQASRAGVRSIMALRLFKDSTTVGVLNLYSTSHETIDDDSRSLATVLARHASIAYSRSLQISHLRRGLETREVIGQAVGIVMERYQLDSARAFDYLLRVSSTSETKLRDVAQQVAGGADAAYAADQS